MISPNFKAKLLSDYQVNYLNIYIQLANDENKIQYSTPQKYEYI